MTTTTMQVTTLDKIVQAANAAVALRGSGQLATKKYAKMIDTHWAAYMFASGNYDSVDLYLGLRAITSARPLEHFSQLGSCDWPVLAAFIGGQHRPTGVKPVKMRRLNHLASSLRPPCSALLLHSPDRTTPNDTMGNTCKYQDWRDLGPVATNFSQDIAATWASNPRAIPVHIKAAMQTAQTALCALDDLIQEHVREELGEEE